MVGGEPAGTLGVSERDEQKETLLPFTAEGTGQAVGAAGRLPGAVATGEHRDVNAVGVGEYGPGLVDGA